MFDWIIETYRPGLLVSAAGTKYTEMELECNKKLKLGLFNSYIEPTDVYSFCQAATVKLNLQNWEAAQFHFI